MSDVSISTWGGVEENLLDYWRNDSKRGDSKPSFSNRYGLKQSDKDTGSRQAGLDSKIPDVEDEETDLTNQTVIKR